MAGGKHDGLNVHSSDGPGGMEWVHTGTHVGVTVWDDVKESEHATVALDIDATEMLYQYLGEMLVKMKAHKRFLRNPPGSQK